LDLLSDAKMNFYVASDEWCRCVQVKYVGLEGKGVFFVHYVTCFIWNLVAVGNQKQSLLSVGGKNRPAHSLRRVR
jgi:hypothetical protein